MKIIHTNLYTSSACDCMHQVLDDISRQSIQLRHRCYYIVVAQEPNGEVVLKYDGHDCRNLLSKYSESDAKIWLARSLKWLTQTADSNLDWTRKNNTTNQHFPNLTIAETYLIYDTLISRKNLEAKYPADLYAKIHGTEKDAMATELEVARREEIAKIKEKWQKKLHDLDPYSFSSEVHNEIERQAREAADNVRAKLMPKALKDLEDAKREYQQELDAVDKMVAFATNDVASFPFA